MDDERPALQKILIERSGSQTPSETLALSSALRKSQFSRTGSLGNIHEFDTISCVELHAGWLLLQGKFRAKVSRSTYCTEAGYLERVCLTATKQLPIILP